MRKISLITNIIGGIMILAFVIFLFCIWGSIPELVPMRFNFSGAVEDYGNKTELIILVAAMIAIFAIIAISEHFPKMINLPVKVTDENRARLYSIAYCMTGVLKVLMVMTMIAAVLSSIYLAFPVWILYILIALALLSGVGGTILCVINR